jgi:hypothetical protein
LMRSIRSNTVLLITRQHLATKRTPEKVFQFDKFLQE